jgi:hypothetical protein
VQPREAAGFGVYRSGITDETPMSSDVPSLKVTESGGLVQLQLGALARGNGASLQEAADDLIQSVLRLLMAVRSGGLNLCREIPPDLDTISFLAELDELAATGGDIRSRLFDE